MAAIQNDSVKKNRKGTKVIHRNASVDLTPMVDLGFILLSFFIFTATLSTPKSMDIMVPNDKQPDISDEVCETCALTVVLAAHDKIFYYRGNSDTAHYNQTNFSAKGIREILLHQKKSVQQVFNQNRFVLIIKPSNQSSLKNMVDILDEVKINAIEKYYLDELNAKDIQLIKN